MFELNTDIKISDILSWINKSVIAIYFSPIHNFIKGKLIPYLRVRTSISLLDVVVV